MTTENGGQLHLLASSSLRDDGLHSLLMVLRVVQEVGKEASNGDTQARIADYSASEGKGKEYEEYKALTSYTTFDELNKAKKQNVTEPTPRWSAPRGDFLKANVDGAYNPGENHGGWGVIIRDGKGQVVAAKAGRVQNVNEAFMTGLCAVLEALKMAQVLGIGQLIIESDAQLLVNAIQRRDVDSPYAVVLREAKLLMEIDFISCDIRYAPRVCNAAAHELAKLGMPLACVMLQPMSLLNLVPM
ncbi:hypothetical protein ACP70R_037131 [Stipagrostis hirtigluma subsp. patula]